MSSKQIDAALDLWGQILDRLSKDEWATIWDPNFDFEGEQEKTRTAYLKAGWTNEEIDARFAAGLDRHANAPVTSPGVSPGAEVILDAVVTAVEEAMGRLGYVSHNRVATGIEPRVNFFAAKTAVIMTNESIVTVGSYFFRFCGLVARAYTRTLNINPFAWDNPSTTVRVARTYLRDSPDLLKYWFSIFASFATTGTHMFVEFKPARKSESLLFEQIARAMEVFAIAHEYGHHHLEHGRDLTADPHREEFEADQFALSVSYEVEERPFIYDNPYLPSGAGGVILLCSLETLRTFGALAGRKSEDRSHPKVLDRLKRFETISLLKPAEFAAYKQFRTAALTIMTAVHEEIVSLARGVAPELRSIADRAHPPPT